MDFKEKRALQKSIAENLSKLETGELSFKEKRALQKTVTTDFVKLQEKKVDVPDKLLDTDAEIQALGTANITDIGEENIYIEKDGVGYYIKLYNTEKYQKGPYDFSNEVVFDDGTGEKPSDLSPDDQKYKAVIADFESKLSDMGFRQTRESQFVIDYIGFSSRNTPLVKTLSVSHFVDADGKVVINAGSATFKAKSKATAANAVKSALKSLEMQLDGLQKVDDYKKNFASVVSKFKVGDKYKVSRKIISSSFDIDSYMEGFEVTNLESGDVGGTLLPAIEFRGETSTINVKYDLLQEYLDDKWLIPESTAVERETIQTYPGEDFIKLVANQFGGGMNQSLPDAIKRYNAEMVAIGSSQVAESYLKDDKGVWVKITEIKGKPGTTEGYAKAADEPEKPVDFSSAVKNFLPAGYTIDKSDSTSAVISTDTGYKINLDIRKVEGADFDRLYATVKDQDGNTHDAGSSPNPENNMTKAVRRAFEDTQDVITSLERKSKGKETPTYNQLKSGDFIDLPANEFIERLKEAAKELGVEESLTMDIIDPANIWKDKREGIANEGVDPEIDYVKNFLDGQEPAETELIALEDVETKLNIGDKFKLKGKVSQVNNDESTIKKHTYKSIAVEFPFNNDWVKTNRKFLTYFTLKDGEIPFKLNDDITLGAELREIKGKKPEKEGDAPIVYYGLNFESPEGFKRQNSDYVDFASEKAVLKHMIGAGVATESSESVTEEEIEFDYDEDVDVNPEGDFSELAEEGLGNESSLNPDVATEKAKNVDEKLWKYAKKIVLRARFDKAPSGDNEKDNEVIKGGKAWGFVQERYQKLVSGKIKAHKKVATESVDDDEIEDDNPIMI